MYGLAPPAQTQKDPKRLLFTAADPQPAFRSRRSRKDAGAPKPGRPPAGRPQRADEHSVQPAFGTTRKARPAAESAEPDAR